METLWLKQQETAKILGVAARSLRDYRAQGLLRYEKDGIGYMYLYRDVLALRDMRNDPDLFCVSHLKTNVMLRRIHQLEREVEILKMMVGSDSKPLPLNQDSAESLYYACIQQLGKQKQSLLDIERWSSIVIGIREKSLDLIAQRTKNTRPWREIIQLVDVMLEELISEEGFKDSLLLQAVHDRLDKARQSLKQEIMLFETTNNRVVPELTAPVSERADLSSFVSPK